VRKLYWALVSPAPADEAWSATAPLAKGGGEGREKMRPTPVREGGQRARTDFRVLARLGPGVALVACAPRTGRTHQIRAHLALSACPILGDGKYGGARAIPGAEAALPRDGIALHARRIAAPHPVPGRQAIDVTAPPPRALGALLTALGLMPEGADGDAFLDYS
jgi:23S rRNA pseudouridine955/2504/2580 synthase